MMTFEYMIFFWKQLLELPFIENDEHNSDLLIKKITLEEQKCCLKLFAALTTFVPLPVNNCFENYRITAIDDPLRMTLFLKQQENELKSLNALYDATKKSCMVSEELLLCSIASHSTVWKYWQASHTNCFEFYNRGFLKIRVWIALVPTKWLELTVKILSKALKRILFKGRLQALMLASHLVHILNELCSQCDRSLIVVAKNSSNWSAEIVNAVNQNKRRLRWGLLEVKKKLGNYLVESVLDILIQKDSLLYDSICLANTILL
jgi:hypothetical protein